MPSSFNDAGSRVLTSVEELLKVRALFNFDGLLIRVYIYIYYADLSSGDAALDYPRGWKSCCLMRRLRLYVNSDGHILHDK